VAAAAAATPVGERASPWCPRLRAPCSPCASEQPPGPQSPRPRSGAAAARDWSRPPPCPATLWMDVLARWLPCSPAHPAGHHAPAGPAAYPNRSPGALPLPGPGHCQDQHDARGPCALLCQPGPAGIDRRAQAPPRVKRRYIKARQSCAKSNVHQSKDLVTSARSMQTEAWGAICNICPNAATLTLHTGVRCRGSVQSLHEPPQTSCGCPASLGVHSLTSPCIACATMLLSQYMRRRHCPPFRCPAPTPHVQLAGISAGAVRAFPEDFGLPAP
jgi:hypothetical protein